MPALTSSRSGGVLHSRPAPPVPRERCHHHLEHTGSAFRGGNASAGTASTFLPSRGRQEGPAWPFHICHSPRSETLITEANCKTKGLLCPSPLFVALHYNDYRLTSMNCTSSKRWAAMFHNIVSHKANTEIPSCLIFY